MASLEPMARASGRRCRGAWAPGGYHLRAAMCPLPGHRPCSGRRSARRKGAWIAGANGPCRVTGGRVSPTQRGGSSSDWRHDAGAARSANNIGSPGQARGGRTGYRDRTSCRCRKSHQRAARGPRRCSPPPRALEYWPPVKTRSPAVHPPSARTRCSVDPSRTSQRRIRAAEARAAVAAGMRAVADRRRPPAHTLRWTCSYARLPLLTQTCSNPFPTS